MSYVLHTPYTYLSMWTVKFRFLITYSAMATAIWQPWPPNAQCRQNRLFGLAASGEKGLTLSEGLGKEYMTWRETSVGKTGTQAEGRHVVIRASQG
jgi:hypothetical protein